MSRDRAAIEQDQLGKLRLLLAELKSNPFYARRLHDARLDASVASLDEFRAKMPFTTKAELVDDQARNPPYGTNLTYPLDHYTRLHATSGTTGAPLRWLDTPQSWQWMLDNWKQVFRAAGVTQRDRAFFAFSFGPFLGFWTAFEAATQLGLLCLPGGGLSSAARIRMILENRAAVLCCTPTYAIRLAEAAGEMWHGHPARDSGSDHGQDGRATHQPVRTIIVAGEPGGSVPAVRQRIESLWPGARVVDHHGMTEVGPVTYECPARPRCLRVIEESYIAEVIGGGGDVGELVLTTLGRTGSPLLRYRTGDLVRPVYLNEGGDAPGPNLCLDGGILGRTDDMVVVRGVNVYPSAVDQLLRADPRIAEYRVEIDTVPAMTQMSVIVEPVPTHANDPALSEAVESSLRTALSLRVPVKLVECGSLPRFEMKAQRWTRR